MPLNRNGTDSEGSESVRPWTELLNRWRCGEEITDHPLWAEIHREVRVLARSRLRRERGRPLGTTELAHLCFIRMMESRVPTWVNRKHFFAIASRVIRRVLVDLARSELARKRQAPIVTLDGSSNLAILRDNPLAPETLIALNQALEELGNADSRQLKVVEMHYFGGLTQEETAEALAVATSTVKLDLKLAKAHLGRQLRGPEEPRR